MTDSEANFWLRAWHAEQTIANPGGKESLNEIADELRDPAIQRYLFDFKRIGNPRLLSLINLTQLMNEAPTSRSSWPILDYLATQTERAPGEVSFALSQIKTTNGFVLERALEVLLQVPFEEAESLFTPLTMQWLDSDANWFDSRLWGKVTDRLLHAPSGTTFAALTAELLTCAATLSSSDYEFAEFVDHLALSSGGSASIADAIESALAAALLLTDHYSRRLPLVDLRRDNQQPVAVLVSNWRTMAKIREAQLSRAVRLLASQEPVMVQLGLIELRELIAIRPGPAGRSILGQLATQRSLLERQTRSEYLATIAGGFRHLDAEVQAEFVEDGLALAHSDDRADVWMGRDILASLRDYLGPRELITLTHLEETFGRYRPDRPSVVIGEWIPHEAPISFERLVAATAPDIKALLVSPPDSASEGRIGSGRDDFVPLLARLSEERPHELMDLLRGDDSDLFDEDVRVAILQGVGTAAGAGGVGLVEPFAIAVDNQLKRIPDSNQVFLRRSLLWSVVRLIEQSIDTDHAAFSDEALTALSSVVRQGVRDSDPAPIAAGGDSLAGDLLTASLNQNRAVAVQAALLMLRLTNLRQRSQALSRALIENLRDETGPAVLAVYGSNFGHILAGRSRALASELKDCLAPDGPQWEPIFAAYLQRHNPSSADATLLPTFEAALFGSGSPSIMIKGSWSSLLIHLLGNALYDNDEETWWPLLVRALNRSNPAEHAAALRSVSGVLRDPERRPDLVRVRKLAVQALSESSQGESRERLTAAAEMLLSGELPLADVGPVLWDLLRAGADVDIRKLVRVLARDCRETPALAASILIALRPENVTPWAVDQQAFMSLLLELGEIEATRQDALRIVDRFGAHGHLFLEPVAKMLHN